MIPSKPLHPSRFYSPGINAPGPFQFGLCFFRFSSSFWCFFHHAASSRFCSIVAGPIRKQHQQSMRVNLSKRACSSSRAQTNESAHGIGLFFESEDVNVVRPFPNTCLDAHDFSIGQVVEPSARRLQVPNLLGTNLQNRHMKLLRVG